MKHASIHRRQLLQTGLALGAGAAATGLIVGQSRAAEKGAAEKGAAEKGAVAPDANRGIAEMSLQTTKLDALYRFYDQQLRLPTTKQGKELTVQAGRTRIVFETVAAERDEPFYHFAFNIPENKLPQARKWQKQRTPLLLRGDQEVIHFSRWNAHSVFFEDPAGNILEYIARHDLDNASPGDFSPADDVLYASEIGLVVDDVGETVTTVKQELGLDIYRDKFGSFASIGDEHALLILVKRNRKWFPNKVRPALAFPVAAAIRGLQHRELEMDDYGYDIKIETGNHKTSGRPVP